MKNKKLALMTVALVLAVSMLAGCSAGGGVEKSYWSIGTYVDTTHGAEMDVIEAFELNITGDNYQLSKTQKTSMDVWIDITYYGSLFGTYTMTETDTELVYTLSAPTRAIAANGQIEAVTSSIAPAWFDSDNEETWPETLDGENAPTKEAIIATALATAFGHTEAVSSITVTVSKDGGQIMSVEIA